MKIDHTIFEESNKSEWVRNDNKLKNETLMRRQTVSEPREQATINELHKKRNANTGNNNRSFHEINI